MRFAELNFSDIQNLDSNLLDRIKYFLDKNYTDVEFFLDFMCEFGVDFNNIHLDTFLVLIGIAIESKSRQDYIPGLKTTDEWLSVVSNMHRTIRMPQALLLEEFEQLSTVAFELENMVSNLGYKVIKNKDYKPKGITIDFSPSNSVWTKIDKIEAQLDIELKFKANIKDMTKVNDFIEVLNYGFNILRLDLDHKVILNMSIQTKYYLIALVHSIGYSSTEMTILSLNAWLKYLKDKLQIIIPLEVAKLSSEESWHSVIKDFKHIDWNQYRLIANGSRSPLGLRLSSES